MSATFNKYKIIEDVWTYPVWTTTFPGLMGCNPRTVYYGTTFTPTRVTQQYVYSFEPEIVTRWRSRSPVSGRRSGYPPFQMTEYKVGRRTVKQYPITIDKDGSNGAVRWFQQGVMTKANGISCSSVISKQWSDGPNQCIYEEQTRNVTGWPTYAVSSILAGEVRDAINSVYNEVIAASNNSFDLLTEIAEMREVPQLIRQTTSRCTNILGRMIARHGTSAMKAAYRMTPKRLLRSASKALRNLGSDWMSYRYGVMPLVYSFHDLHKTAQRGFVNTEKCTKIVSPTETGASVPGSGNYLLTRDVGAVTVRACSFSYYNSNAVAKLSSLGMNPVLTAWELMPYSFVVDWFINVGGYLAAVTGANLATRNWVCISRRDQYSTQTLAHVDAKTHTRSIASHCPLNWTGVNPGWASRVIEFAGGEQVYDETILDSYQRWLAPGNGAQAQLVISPSINWKRMIDGSVLSINQLRTLLRSLKK